MNTTTLPIPPATLAPMSVFERYLTVWVFLCIVVGIALGQMLPGPFQAIGRMEVAKVNLPVGLLIWVMIIPMLLRVDFASLSQVKQHWRGIGVTLFVNWAVKPFSMALLGWIFIRHVFAPYLPAGQADSYIAGLILLAAAPCTAMVFVWSRLTGGHPLFTLSQVALNDSIMVFAFAPIVALLLGLSAIVVPWDTLITSVVLYIVIPVVIAQLGRKVLLGRGQAVFDAALAKIGPWSITALLATLVLLFAFQGKAILDQPLVIAMLAVPILIQVFFNSGLAYWLNRQLGESHAVACPSALIGASNFFELAVAAAISLFGFESGAALATVVGVLIEVPVMLLVVKIVNDSKGWYEAGAAQKTGERARTPTRKATVSLLDLSLPHVDTTLFDTPTGARLADAGKSTHAPRYLLLYGSLRERSYSKLLTLEAARLLVAMGGEVRVFDPAGLPLPDAAPETHPKVQELRDAAAWAEGMVWTSPERHGAMTGIMKAQIDWIPLSIGAVRPTQGKTLAVMEVSGGSQSFNAVNQLRVLGRWMRMVTIPNQSSVAKAFLEFDEDGRMKPSAYYDRVVDVMEELMKFTLLTRDAVPYLVDRYSERKESAIELTKRVNQRAT